MLLVKNCPVNFFFVKAWLCCPVSVVTDDLKVLLRRKWVLAHMSCFVFVLYSLPEFLNTSRSTLSRLTSVVPFLSPPQGGCVAVAYFILSGHLK